MSKCRSGIKNITQSRRIQGQISRDIAVPFVDRPTMQAAASSREEHDDEASTRVDRYMQVDPANRLVADSLEADRNSRLRALAEAQAEYQCVPLSRGALSTLLLGAERFLK
jgi:hypothetical protein